MLNLFSTFYKNKLLLLLLPVLLGAQLLAFFILVYYNSEIASETVDSELESGTNAYLYSALVRRESRQQAANLTARDYSLQYVFASGKRSTIESALTSHLQRTGANIILLADKNNKIVARAEVAGEKRKSAGITDGIFDDILKDVGAGKRNIAPIEVDKQPVGLYIWVKSVIRAPQPIGSVYLAYRIDDTIADGFSKITGLGLSFWGRVGGGDWFKYASAEQEFVIPENFSMEIAGRENHTITDKTGNGYRIKSVSLSSLPGYDAVTVVSKEFTPVLKPFAKLKIVFGLSILLSSIVFTLMAVRISKAVVTPLLLHAHRDALTDLMNRRSFDNALAEAESAFRKKGNLFTVLLMDLNKFKPINDTFGHEAGDEVLREVAARISRSVRRGDVLARLGGDEFAIIINGIEKERLASLGNSIHHALSVPIKIKGGIEVSVGCSIGLATVQASDLSAADVLRRADQAMYNEKSGSAR